MYSLKHLFYSFFIFSFLSCGEAEQEVTETTKAPAEKGISYADSTRHSLQQLLQAYYSLKDALVAADSVKAAAASLILGTTLDSLNLSSVQQKDTALYAEVASSPAIIKTAALNLNKAPGLEAQREIFETISDNVYELIKNLKPAGIETYHQYCPMAFNDKGAHWLSDTTQIRNPYFGKKMLTCGEVQEELRYQ
jgi:hypothetical protein